MRNKAAELDRRQNWHFWKVCRIIMIKTQGRPPLPNFYEEMKRRGRIFPFTEFSKSINYLQTHQIETMDDLQEQISEELNGVVSVSKKKFPKSAKQLKNWRIWKKWQSNQNKPAID